MIYRLRGPERDRLGDPTGEPTRTLIPGAFTAPRTSSDVTSGTRDGVVVGLTLFHPNPSVDLLPTDRVEVDGEVWDIEGTVGRWQSPYGAGADGVQVALKRGVG